MRGRTRIVYHSVVAVLAIGVVYASSPRLQSLAQTVRPRKPASASCSGTLYVYEQSRFLSVDRSTGNTTYVSTIDVSKLSHPLADLHMRFAPDGTLYGSDKGRRLIIDIDTGAVSDDGLDVEAVGKLGSASRWMPPGYRAEGSPVVGYSTNKFGGGPGSLNFTRIDSLEPFVRIAVPFTPIAAYNIGIGDTISGDGSLFFFVTTDMVYRIPVSAPSMFPWISLGALELSSDARLDTDDNDHMLIVDGVFLYDTDLVNKSVKFIRLSGNGISFVQDVLFRRCPQGGVRISPTRGLQTSESATTATFDAVLTKAPTSDVTIGISSSLPGEGTPSPTSLTFSTANWNVPQTVTVTGVADQTIDGNKPYTIVTSAASSSDPNYSGRAVSDVQLTNIDVDTAAINVSPSNVTVTENGPSVPITISLTSRPSADVTVPLSVSNGQATLSASSVTFTNADWSPRQVLVTAVADQIDDDDQPFTINIDPPAASADPNYAGIDPNDVSGIAVDADTASIVVAPGTLSVTEGGPSVPITISLTSRPLADVTIPISVSNGQATVSASSVTFTNANWSPRQVQVTAVNDAIADGDLPFTLVLSPPTSADPLYAAIDPADVSGIAVDNDTASVGVTPTSGLVTTEAGGQATFQVVLGSQPAADVRIDFTSSNPVEATVAPPFYVFTSANWNVPRTVTITGVDDGVADGNRSLSIITTLSTTDPVYARIDPADVTLLNIDRNAIPALDSWALLVLAAALTFVAIRRVQ